MKWGEEYMSWYYSFYCGVKTKEGKIYPIGPFDADGKFKPVVENSKSFEPEELHRGFYSFKEDEITPEIREIFEDVGAYTTYLPLNDLPEGNGLKFGYFLIDEVDQYKKDPDDCDLFYDWYTPDVYYAKADAELKFGAPPKESDIYGNDMTPHSCRDYMPFAYIDTGSAAYYAERIRQVSYLLYDNYDLEKKFGEGATRVVILSQG